MDMDFNQYLAADGEDGSEDDWVVSDMAGRVLQRLWDDISYSDAEKQEPMPERSETRAEMLDD
mgnify:CR=1 FL=1